jgi:hypothetical protein
MQQLSLVPNEKQRFESIHVTIRLTYPNGNLSTVCYAPFLEETMKYKMLPNILVSLSLASLLVCQASAADPKPILVCYPGGPVKATDANNAMGSMLRVVEKVGQWPSGSFTSLFTAKASECKQILAEKKPGFTILSLGLYLELRNQYHLVPIAQPKIKGMSNERYRILVKQGTFKSVAELKGKTLGGTVLEEPQFVQRIIFAGTIDPTTHFVLKHSPQALRSLRALSAGGIDAVIVNEQQFSSLGSLPFAKELEPIFSSEPIPLIGLVANEQQTSAEERARLAKALYKMCVDDEGKKLCEMFGVESFDMVDRSVFEPMIKLWVATGGK